MFCPPQEGEKRVGCFMEGIPARVHAIWAEEKAAWKRLRDAAERDIPGWGP